MIRFRNHHAYQHTPDDITSSSDEAVISSDAPDPPSYFPEPQQPEPTRQETCSEPHPLNESMAAESSNADALMDLAATIPSSKIVYQMEEKKTAEDDVEVERIVSAVTRGLRKNPFKKSSSSKRNSNSSSNNNKLIPPRTSKSVRQLKGSKASADARTPIRKTVSRPTTKPQRKVTTPTGVEVVPIVSDDEKADHSRSKQQRQGPKLTRNPAPKEEPGFFSRMLDDSVDSTTYTADTSTNGVDYDYNYIDDESYGDTTNSSSGSSSYSTDSSSVDGKSASRPEDETDDDSDDSTASLTDEVESSFDTMNGSTPDDEDEETQTFRKQSTAPQGLDIVAHLLSGAKEMSFDAYSVTAHDTARDIAEALAHTNTLQKVSLCGPWKGHSNKTRQILEILFDGLLQNTSLHTLVLKDNHCLDRYAGYAFGTFLKAHNSHGSSHIQKLEITKCKFVGSGWNSLFLGLQHSNTIKRLSVEDCTNLGANDIDCITSTIHYLELEHIKLVNVGLHKMHHENLAFLLRAIQQTKTLKEVDLSRNNLGAAPRAILLLSRCMSGDPVWIETKMSERDYLPANYHHHIEKLTLVDCGIADKASIKTLAKSLDSKIAKLDANGSEHPLVLHTLDVSKNKFGNSGCKIFEKLLEDNASITTLGMVGCGASASHLKTVADRLRYNNSFLQKIGLSSGVSLAILDSVSAVENVFSGRSTATLERADTGTLANEDEDSDLEATTRMSGCGTC